MNNLQKVNTIYKTDHELSFLEMFCSIMKTVSQRVIVEATENAEVTREHRYAQK